MDAQEATFYWYDYETFGLDRRRDRPAQFAGLRTTLELEPVGEGEVFYAKPSDDYLPSPESVLLTRILPQTCEERGVPEREFAQAVWERFNRPGTISLGYNTLGFDNEVSRFLFWRNFLDPYSHQWKNGCGYWDLFPVVCAYWALRGEGINWPLWENLDPNRFPDALTREGVCFKLEVLTQANGLTHNKAHDALSDVEATVALARLLRQRSPKFWEWALKNRTKEAVQNALMRGPVLWISPAFGQQRGFMKLVAFLAMSPHNRNEALVWDLAYDPEPLLALSKEEWSRRLFARKEDLAEGEERLPIARMSINACPFVCADLRVLSDERARHFGLDVEAARRHAGGLEGVLDRLGGAATASMKGPDRRATDIDAALYQKGFSMSREDERTRNRLGSLPTADLAAERVTFEDADLQRLYIRHLGRNAPEALTAEERRAWRAFCKRRLLTGEEGIRSLNDYAEEIDRLQEGVMDDEEASGYLEALYEWGETLGERCA